MTKIDILFILIFWAKIYVLLLSLSKLLLWWISTSFFVVVVVVFERESTIYNIICIYIKVGFNLNSKFSNPNEITRNSYLKKNTKNLVYHQRHLSLCYVYNMIEDGLIEIQFYYVIFIFYFFFHFSICCHFSKLFNHFKWCEREANLLSSTQNLMNKHLIKLN